MGVAKRARGEPAATNMAVDLAVVNAHAQWWSSDLKLPTTALSHQMVEGSDEAEVEVEAEAEAERKRSGSRSRAERGAELRIKPNSS